MGPTGEGWETFKIEGGVDLGLDDLDGDLDGGGGDWIAEGALGQKWGGQTSFDMEARKKESKIDKQRKLQVPFLKSCFLPQTQIDYVKSLKSCLSANTVLFCTH